MATNSGVDVANSGSDINIYSMIHNLAEMVKQLDKKNAILHGLWTQTRDDLEKLTANYNQRTKADKSKISAVCTQVSKDIFSDTMKDFVKNLTLTELTDSVTQNIFNTQNIIQFEEKIEEIVDRKSDSIIERIKDDLEVEDSDSEESSSDDSEAETPQPDVQQQQSYQDTNDTLKNKLQTIEEKLQDFSDSRTNRTLLISRIGLKQTAEDIVNSKSANIWPVIVQEFSRRGIAFLLLGAADIRIFKNGSVRICYGTQFAIRRAIYQLKCFINSLKRQQQNRFYSELYTMIKNITYSILTPKRFQHIRAELQLIANDHKRRGDWSRFEFMLQRKNGVKILVLRGYLRNQSGFVDIIQS